METISTSLVLGRWKPGEWPEYVAVSHEGMREPGRRYFPERTCRVIATERMLSQTQKGVTKSRSECGREFWMETHNLRLFPGLVLNEVEVPIFCSQCGAKVVE